MKNNDSRQSCQSRSFYQRLDKFKNQFHAVSLESGVQIEHQWHSIKTCLAER